MKVKIVCNAVRAKFTAEGGELPVGLIDSVTSCFKHNFHQMPAYRNRQWDGKLHLFYPGLHTLPVGVLNLAVDALTKAGHGVEIYGISRLPVAFPDTPAPMGKGPRERTPRDYQIQAVDSVEATPWGQWGHFRIGTGGGKTLVASMLCRKYQVKTLILVYGQNLVEQTYDEVSHFLKGIQSVGMIMGNDWSDADVTVASVSTLTSRLATPEVRKFLASIQMVIPDECHMIAGGKSTFQKVLDSCMNARIKIGMSGTPTKKTEESALLLMSRTGPLLIDVPPERLQADGHLCPAKLVVYGVHAPKLKHLTYQEAVKELIHDHRERTVFIIGKVVEAAKAGGKVLIIAGNSRAYTASLKAEYERRSSLDPTIPHAAFVTGTSGRVAVKKAVDQLRRGDIKVLCSTVLFDQGTNICDLDWVFMPSNIKAFTKVMQRIGRGLRKKSGSGFLTVVDFMDTTNKYLVAHFKARLKIYGDENIFSEVSFGESGIEPTAGDKHDSSSFDEYDPDSDDIDLDSESDDY